MRQFRVRAIFLAAALLLMGVAITPLWHKTVHAQTSRPAASLAAAVPGALPANDQLSPDMKPVPALSPFIDGHTHFDAPEAAAAIQAALKAMKEENAAKIIFLPSPFTLQDKARFDADVIAAAEKAYPSKFAFMGGGGTLNPMIQEAARTREISPELKQKFRQAAEEIVREGAAGFGEMSAEHFATATPYQSVAPDHPLFLLLADIAAEHNMPIDIHMEALPQNAPLPSDFKSPPNAAQLHENMAAFERLLAHNPRAKILWAHEGWDNTGYRTVELSRRLLKAHPNLYMEIKLDPLAVGKNSPLENGATGKIKPDWLKLFEDFPDRFVIGSDQHYPMPKTGPQRWQAVVLLFNQLPPELRHKIGIENPMHIYRFKSE
jgi:hypothetical protein